MLRVTLIAATLSLALVTSCGSSATSGFQQKSIAAKTATEELRTRFWNPIARPVIVLDPNGEGAKDFIWSDDSQFPFPQFKARDPAVYEAFAFIFDQFFNEPGVIEFLISQDLLNKPLVASSKYKTMAMTFYAIADQYATPGALPYELKPETRVKMVELRTLLASSGAQ